MPLGLDRHECCGPPQSLQGSETIEMTDGHYRRDCPALAIPLEPSAAALIHLGVEFVIDAYERDPQATLARLADVAARGGEPFQIPPELLIAE